MAMLGLARQSGRRVSSASPSSSARLARSRRLTERERLRSRCSSPSRRESDARRHRDRARAPREVSPTTSARRQILARDEIRRGNTDKAIRIFEELLATDPNNADAYNQIGYYYGYRGDYVKVDGVPQEVPVHRRRQRQPVRLPGRGPGLLRATTTRPSRTSTGRSRSSPTSSSPTGTSAWRTRAWASPRRRSRSYVKAVGASRLATDMQREYLMAALRVACVAHDEETAAVRTRRRVDPSCRRRSTGARPGRSLDAAMALVEGRPAEAEKRIEACEAACSRRSSPRRQASRRLEAALSGLRTCSWPLAKEQQGKHRRGARVLEEERQPAEPVQQLRGPPPRSTRRAPTSPLALAKRGDLDAAEKLIAENRKWNPSWAPTREAEPTVARAAPREGARRRARARPQPSMERSSRGTSRPSTSFSSSRRSTTPASRSARCPTRRRSSRTCSARAVGVLDASRGYLATFGEGGAPPRRGARRLPAAAHGGDRRGRTSSCSDVLRVGGRAAREKFQLLGRPVPTAIGVPHLRRRPADRRPRARRQGGAPRRPGGRVRRGGRAVPRVARGPLRDGDREPPAPGAADARARAPRGGEPAAARRDRPVGRRAALRRRLAGGAPRARPRRRASPPRGSRC